MGYVIRQNVIVDETIELSSVSHHNIVVGTVEELLAVLRFVVIGDAFAPFGYHFSRHM